ncbi:hypothetical protein BOTBODRAFT_172501 [Botryobasidium botryosum FD-172 SS1]|uniref:BAR domain-containing protein n=1 Tax=Botryobasidium botryosum (strain FD-172 SS1) TaxID=930990 RepID=A0A067MQB9_BOTB1|nr:hypothetical protein BOTBODRAFT_172501 [Botryobasidium botryosum FD-172 SS1]
MAGKLRQWAGKVLSSKEQNVAVDEATEFEKVIDQRRIGTERLHAASDLYLRAITKKKDVPGGDSSMSKVFPIEALGVVMISHSEVVGAESPFGRNLLSFGRMHRQVASFQDSFAESFQSTYLASLEKSMDLLKEYQVLRKKLESRKAAYESAVVKVQKAKKEKEKREAEDELELARSKHEQTEEDIQNQLQQISECERENRRNLTELLDIHLAYVTNYHDLLIDIKAEWIEESPDDGIEFRRPRGSTLSVNRLSAATPVSAPRDSPTPSGGSTSESHHDASGAGTADSKSRKRSDSVQTDVSGGKRKSTWMGSLRRKSLPRDKSFQQLDNDADTDTAWSLVEPDRSMDPSPAPSPRGTPRSSSISLALGKARKNSSASGTRRGAGGGDTIKKSSPPPPARPQRVVRAIFNYAGTAPGELALRIGDEVILGDVSDGWGSGECKGKTGLFPINHTEEITNSTTPRKVPPPLPTNMRPSIVTRQLSPPPPTPASYIDVDSVYNSDSGDTFGDHHAHTPDDEHDQAGLLLADTSAQSLDVDSKNGNGNWGGGGGGGGGTKRQAPRPPSNSSASTRKAPPPPPPSRRALSSPNVTQVTVAAVTATGTPPVPPRPSATKSKSGTSTPRNWSPFHKSAALRKGDDGDADSYNDERHDNDETHLHDAAALICGECGCEDFVQNLFKEKGYCSSCFHSHT